MVDLKETVQGDWELGEDYYRDDGTASELRLEDFMGENTESGDEAAGSPDSPKSEAELRLEKTIGDVRRVLALAQKGRTVGEIARELGLEEPYVYDIQVTAQGFREDDEIAVAHMMCM